MRKNQCLRCGQEFFTAFRRMYCEACGKFKKQYAYKLRRAGICKKCKTLFSRDRQNSAYCKDCRKRTRGKEHTILPKLRFQVLAAYGFTCQYCGAKAPDVRLHVDHKRPIAEGGKTELGNLTVACWECNIGKGKQLLNVE